MRSGSDVDIMDTGTDDTNTGATIHLYPSQVGHVQKLKDILREHPLALDLSMLGSGKTYTASHIALQKEFGFTRVVVIAPVSVRPKWDDMRARFGVPIAQNVSFSQLRSVKCKQPKHGLLLRRDYTTDLHIQGTRTSVDKVVFSTTALFRRYVDEGLLLVIDEVQAVKNVSSQFLACRSLIREIVEAGGRSRVLLLSGSPIDRREQVVTLFRTMHVMTGDELASFNVGLRVLEWRGMLEIEAHCSTLDQAGVVRVRARLARAGGQVAQGRLERYCYELFQRVFKPARSSAMAVQSLGAHVSKLNSFFEVEDVRDRAALAYGVDALSRACSYNSGTGEVELMRTGTTALESLRLITRSLLQIETGKIGVLARAASLVLDADPCAKVVICINYSTTLRDLVSRLSSHSPLVLDGGTSVQRRMEVLRTFQAPDVQRRLLIGNVSVMSTGIDLDDKDGGFPRTALVNPSYSTIALYQLGHRFLRADTRSDSRVLFVFGKHATELHLLEALARKSCVMKQTTREQSIAGVVFPGDYGRVDGDRLLSPLRLHTHVEGGLVGVVEPVSEEEQGAAVLVVQTGEAEVAGADELEPGDPETHALVDALAPELQALEVTGGGDVQIQHPREVLAAEPALGDCKDPSRPAGLVNLSQQEPDAQVDQ